MIRHLVIPLCLILALSCTPGCFKPSDTPISISEMTMDANLAGNVAASIYVAAAHPKPTDIDNVHFVLDLLSTNLTNYQAGGFTSASHTINNQIDLHISPTTDAASNSLCKTLANIMLVELDSVFRQHPEWQRQGSDIAGIVSSFTSGASSALLLFRDRGVIPPPPKHRGRSGR
jgi:hypothetical protein